AGVWEARWGNWRSTVCGEGVWGDPTTGLDPHARRSAAAEGEAASTRTNIRLVVDAISSLRTMGCNSGLMLDSAVVLQNLRNQIRTGHQNFVLLRCDAGSKNMRHAKSLMFMHLPARP